MPRGRARRRRLAPASRSPPRRPTSMATTPTMAVPKASIGRKPWKWEAFRPMHSGCTMFMAMCGSGCRIVGMITTRVHRKMALPGNRETVPGVRCAAARGTTTRGGCVPPSATGTCLRIAASSWGSGSPGPFNFLLFSFPFIQTHGVEATERYGVNLVIGKSRPLIP